MLDPAIRAEKLLPPRPLRALGAALYGPPVAPSKRAWLAWIEVPPDQRRRGLGTAALAAVVAAARSDGATSLCAGGPPGNYVACGVEAGDAVMRAFLEARGFRRRGVQVDLTVLPGPPVGQAPRALAGVDIARCGATEAAVLPWIGAVFERAWATEAERALAHDGLFVARRDTDGGLVGFAAHSGNNVAWGTFGPIGVAPDARGGGLGRALATVVLDDLAARGFERVTVPWVDRATVPFYEGLARVVARVERIGYVLALPDGLSGGVARTD